MTASMRTLRSAVRLLHLRPALADAALEVLLSSTEVRTGARHRAGRGPGHGADRPAPGPGPAGGPGGGPGDGPGGDEATPERLRGLAELAAGGDAEAFGLLYDHYVRQVYRYVAYRVGSRALAEDLTSETFARALRAVKGYRWQGKDFGAWLTTIARNLVADHYKSSRARLEVVADEVPETTTTVRGPEEEVLDAITADAVMSAVRRLPEDQRECLLLRFVQGLGIAQTAEVLGRSEGAIKQLQLRAVRRLARELPPEAVR